MADPEIVKGRDLRVDESAFDRVGKPVGVEQHDAGDAEHRPAEKAKSHTLQDMSTDYEFFTTGVIHAVTPFDRDPITEYLKLYPTDNSDEMPLAIDHTESFFQGLGVCLAANTPVNFDRRIYAILRDRWIPLRDMIAGFAMIERKAQFYARTNFYELDIVDPFALSKQTIVDKLPIVTITVFGVSSNQSFSYISPRGYPVLPQLVTEEPKTDMVTEGDAVLGPPPSPEHLQRSNDEI